MNKKLLLVIAALLLISVSWFYMTHHVTKVTLVKESIDLDYYYTCPMHPAVHSDKEGFCPICHMGLVKVKKTSGTSKGLSPSQAQIDLIGVQKIKVETKDASISTILTGRYVGQGKIIFQIYESDISIMKIGAIFKGKSVTDQKSELEGTILGVDNVVDSMSRTIRVTGKFRESGRELPLESTFQAEIITFLKNKILIPHEAVLRTGDADLVYVFANDGKLYPRPVKIGMKSKTDYEVIDGLGVGEFISGGANFLIDSEAKIRGNND